MRSILHVALLSAALLCTSPLRAQSFDAGLLPNDQFSGAIDDGADVDVLLFEALVDTKLTISLNALKPAVLRATVRLIDLADESVVAEAIAVKSKLKLVAVAPATGPYRIEVSSSDGSTGPYKLAYKEKLSKTVTKLTLDDEVADGADFDALFDALQGFQLTGKLQRFPKKSAAVPAEPQLLRPQGGGELALDDKTLKTNKKGDRFTLKKVPLDASGTWTLRSANDGETGGLRAKLKLKRIKQKKRKIDETVGPDTLPAPALDALPAMTAGASLLITGSGVTPFGKVQVEGGVTTVVATANADGIFSADVPLKTNAVQSLFVTQLQDGVQGLAATHEVVQDSQPPTIIIDFPLDGAVLGASTTNVSGRVGDLLSGFTGLNVTVDGVAANVNVGVGTNGSFDLAGVTLTQGSPTTLQAVATDALGNTASASINVLYKLGPGAKLDVVSGDNQFASVGSSLADPLVVSLTNTADAPLAGRPVSFRVVKSDGLLSAMNPATTGQLVTVLTDLQGEATVDWQLGSDAGMGNNRVEVSAAGVPGAIYFSASATAAAATQIAVGTGNDQVAQAGSTLPQSVSVWVSDGINGAAGVPVTFSVGAGSGGLRLVGSNAVPVPQLTFNTDLTGRATVRWLIGDDPGRNQLFVDFPGNVGKPVQFRALGLAKEFTATRFTGLVLDNSRRQLGGALCELHFTDGTDVSTSTDVNGRFEFSNLPTSGQAQLAVHGDTATTLSGAPINPAALVFPELHFEAFVVEGAPNALPRPVLLPPLDPKATVVFDGTRDVELPLAGLEGLTFFLDADTEVRRADGTLVTQAAPLELSVSPVHVYDIPMPFADGALPPFAWTLQPGGTTFDPPLRMQAPNIPGLPAGAVAYFLSFNHDTMRFEIVSNATVSADATSIVSDPGQGIAVAGWGGFCPPYPCFGDLCPSDDIDCLLPDELVLLGGEADDEEEDEILPTSGTAQSTAQGVMNAPGKSAFDIFADFVDDGTLGCLGSTQQCAAMLQAELASDFSASAFAAWSLSPEASTYKMLMSMLHGSFSTLRGVQADAHALGIGISWPIALADTQLADFQDAITAFDPALLEAARQQVEDDHDALVALLSQLAAGAEGGTLQDLDDLFNVAAVNAAALQAGLDEFDELALHVDALSDLLLMQGAMVSSGFTSGTVDSVGGYVVPNIPESGGPQRVEVILQAGDLTLYGRSAWVEVLFGQGVNSGPIVLSTTPLPDLVSMTAELQGGSNVIDMLETPVAVETTGIFSDGAVTALGGFDDGLLYSSSNDIVLSLDADGMATAHQAGLAMISVSREGAVASFLVFITPGTPTTTVSGMVVDTGSVPVVGADVSTNEGGMGTSVANGMFDLAGQLASSATLDVHAELGASSGFTLGVPVVPGGTTQAGLLVIDVDGDGDGLPDWYETNLYGSDPALSDTDGDGLDDGIEVLQLGTDPTLADSDGDTFDDNVENMLGSDPTAFDAPTTIAGSLMLDGGGVPANGLAHIAGVPSALYEAIADGAGDFAFAPYPASLSPVTVLGSAPGGFSGASSQTATVPDGTTDVGDIVLELSLDPLYLGRKFELSERPTEIATGDLNGDGRPDLAVSLGLASSVEILLAQPGGTFEVAGQASVVTPHSVVLDDFDGNLVLDLAVTASSGAGLHVFLGNGDGSFTFNAMYSVSLAPFDVLSFDANGDQISDLHVMTNTGNVNTLLGNGDGTFGAPTTVPVGNSPRSMKAGLVNGDAFIDLVVANVGTQDVTILLGDGGGSFAPLTQDVALGPAEVALGLFDNDAVLDIVLGSAFDGTTRVLSGNGDGTFVDIGTFDAGGRAVDFECADLDGNGTLDLLQATQSFDDLRVMYGNGDGTFAAPVEYEVGPMPATLVLADFDTDGEPDVVVGNSSSQDLSVLLGDGTGAFDVAPGHDTGFDSISAALGDLNGDNALDLVVANNSFDHSKVLLGDGNGGFGPLFNVSLPSTSDFLLLGLIDGDALPDLISLRANSNGWEVRLGLGTGDFMDGTDIYTGDTSQGAALGMLDAGTTLDLLVTNRLGNDFTVLLGNGDGTFVQQPDVPAGTSPTVVRLGDLDGNGTLDSVITDVFDDQFLIHLNDGTGTFTPAAVPAIALPDDARDFTLADLDGNGTLDIVATSLSDDMMFVLLGNGDGSFGAVNSIDAGLNPISPLAADFNGDGALDVALLNESTNEMTLLLGDGVGGFLESQLFDAGPEPRVLLLGLLDGDALPDLISINESDELSRVLLHQ